MRELLCMQCFFLLSLNSVFYDFVVSFLYSIPISVMRKIYLAALMLLLAATIARAQSVIGLKAGVHYATIAGDETAPYNGSFGFHAGLAASLLATEMVYIQPELLYSRLGLGYETGSTALNSRVSGERTLSYISLPIMVKVYLAEGFNVQFGPQFAYLISANAEGERTLAGNTQPFDEDVKDDFNNFDFGVGLGLGYRFGAGFGIDARWNLGLININENDDLVHNNSVVQLSAAYFFGE